MSKSKFRQEQETKMESYSVRMTAAHVRVARRAGGGVIAEGVRKLIENEAAGFKERRRGPRDRRKIKP